MVPVLVIEFQVSRFLSRSGFGIISMMWCPRKLTQGQIEERRLEGGRLLRAGRLTHAEIARRLGISLRAVRQWAKQLRDHPSSGLRALRSRHRPGRPSRLSAAQWHSILKTFRKGALKAGFETDRWTLRRIRDLIRRNSVSRTILITWPLGSGLRVGAHRSRPFTPKSEMRK